MHNLQNHQTTSVSKKPLKKFLRDQGNIQIEELMQIIISPLTGKPDLLAIDIYSEARSWFRPKTTKRNGNVIYSSKLTGRGWKTNYNHFVKKYRCSSETIRKKFVLLEALGLLSRDFSHEYSYSRLYNNSMSILVWKDTPFFYSEIGVDRITTTPPNLDSLGKKAGGSIQGNVDIIYSNPNNRNKEIEDSPYRAISSISETSKKECARAANETSPLAALPLTGSSTGEFLAPTNDRVVAEPIDPAKPAKPRLVITAAMQQGAVPMPSTPQASGLAKGEVSTIATDLVPPTLPPPPPIVPPITPPPAMTAEQEREQLRLHRDRRQETASDVATPIGATILSLLPKLALEAGRSTNTQQRGADFQSTVENSKACGTPEHGIGLRAADETESKTEYLVTQPEPEGKPNDLDAEFQRVLTEKAERKAIWQSLLYGVTELMGETYDPLSGKMRKVTLEDIQGQFGSMNYKVDLEHKQINLQAKSELWIPAFELVYAASFNEAAMEAGYSFELVRTLEKSNATNEGK